MKQKVIQNIERALGNKIAMAILCTLVSAILLLLPFWLGKPSTEVKTLWADFFGGAFHPIMLHLPIGALLLVFSLEAIGLVARKYKFNMTLPLMFNAATAIVAAVFGILWYYGGDFNAGEKLDDHLWQGLIFSAVSVWLPFIYTYCKNKAQIFYYLTLIGSVGVMTSAAHLGGESVHGPIMKHPFIEGEKPKRRAVKPGGVSETGDGVSGAEAVDLVVYTDVIVPIFEQKCYSCHHSEEKQKSGFIMDTLADILKGGEEYQETDPALTPGDAANSFIVTTIELPLDDDLHMPPESKAQVSADELTLLKWWVNAGASDTATLSELKPSEEILKIIGAPAPQSKEEDEQPNREKKGSSVTPADSPLAPKVNVFLEKYPNALTWTSQADSTLNFTAASIRSGYTDADIDALMPFAEELVELNFNATKVGDKVADLVMAAPKLHTLKLAETQVTDAFLELIAKHPSLELLVLHSTPIGDAGIAQLAEMSSLKKLYLWQTKVTPEGVQALQQKLPDCEVNLGL